MRKLALRRPSPALVVACLALLVALGGTSIAAVTQVAKNSVGANQLKSNAVTNPKMANNAVKAPELASNAVVAAKIASNAVGSAKIASNAVTGPKIAANAVTGEKIADGSVAAADLASGVLPTPSAAFARFVNGPVPVPDAVSEIANLSVTAPGNYVISSKVVLSSSATGGTVTCRLEAGTDTDQSETLLGGNSPATISNLVVHNFTAAGSVSFRCGRTSLISADASQIKIAAIGVTTLTNSG
jgi:hypothetical protein